MRSNSFFSRFLPSFPRFWHEQCFPARNPCDDVSSFQPISTSKGVDEGIAV